MNKTVYILLCLLVSGCFGYTTPVPKNKKDLMKMSMYTDWIRGRSLTDDDIVYLKKFQWVRYIDLGSYGESNITDEGLKTLAELGLRFSTLSVEYNNNITDEGIRHISSIDSLSRIGLKVNPKLTNKAIEYLAEMENLRSLDIRGCPEVTDEGLGILARKNGLEDLVIGTVCLGPREQRNAKKKGIDINNIENSLTIEGIMFLAQNNSLETLYIQTSRDDLLTEENIKRIQNAFSNSNCSIVTLKGSKDVWRGPATGRIWELIQGEPVKTFPDYE